MARWAILACTGVLAWCGCSPYGGGAFTCEIDSQCGADGACSDGYCSFPDPLCDSGRRYGDLSGPLSGTCVADDTPPVDAAIDAPKHCYGTGLVMACFDAPPTGTLVLGANMQINTDTDPRCAATTNSVPACVLAAETITVGTGFFAATGTKPLVLVATQTISVTGTLTASSNRQFNFTGAGSDMPGCNAGTAPTGSSGGAGGSFGGVGGNGADAPGTAGIAGAALTPTTLRGGCSGQDGGDDVAPLGPGAKGRGGGALYLIAETSITVGVGGIVAATGGGGTGGGTSDTGGGGGGGSGGFIGLDTPSLMVMGSVLANGGGGGEGSGAQSTGAPGQDNSTTTVAAAGGSGGSDFGTNGGAGSVAAQKNGGNGAAACTGTCTSPSSGGGGGGGAGIIKVYRATAPGSGVSPAPS